jgi:transcriptional regulator with XRE-family HTH domain
MNIRQVLSTRIRELMESRVTLDTQTKLANKSGVGQSTIQRILAEDASATIDTVEQIAGAFGVPAVDLLSATAKDRRLLALWDQLADVDKSRVLSFIEVSIEADKQNRPIDFTRGRPLDARTIEALRPATKLPPQDEQPAVPEVVDAKRKRGRPPRT